MAPLGVRRTVQSSSACSLNQNLGSELGFPYDKLASATLAFFFLFSFFGGGHVHGVHSLISFF